MRPADKLRREDGRLFNPEAVEINAVEHCNLRCVGCSHLSPVMRKREADPRAVHRDLVALARVYRAAVCKIVGGEPLLHRDLPTLLDAVRDSAVAARLRVCTNGLLLERMDRSFWSRIDEVEVSIYPGEALSAEAYRRIARTAADHGAAISFFRYAAFRLPYPEQRLGDGRLIRRIYATCKIVHTWLCHNVHDGYFYKCPQAVFVNKLEPDGEARAHRDGVALVGGDDLAARLADYLGSPWPLATCARCLGTVGRAVAHAQTPRRDWRTPQSGDPRDLVDLDFLAAVEADIDADDGSVRPWDPFADPPDHEPRALGASG
jgi:organic radical activating enzyme